MQRISQCTFDSFGVRTLAARPVQLSILLPTNRIGPVAISRIAQACSWAGSNIEVIVRDNSGNAEKREILKHFQYEHCTIIAADPCEPLESFSETLKLAKGDFVFISADDDLGSDRAIAALPDMIGLYGRDPMVAGFTGSYVVENSRGTNIYTYKDADSNSPVARVSGLLDFPGPNILFYSALRRELVERISTFMRAMPFYLSFHDHMLSLFYLLNGKFIHLQRLFYVYDLGAWEFDEPAQKRDLNFYTAAGLDPAMNKLHWLMCGFEGALLAMNSDAFPDIPIAQREVIAARWFALMHSRFKVNTRLSFGSPLDEQADKLCDKLRAMNGQLSIQDALSIISNFIALSSKAHAQKYFDYWNAMINRRRPALHQTGT